MGTCGQPGYAFRDFCLKQGIDFIIFCLQQGIFLNSFVIANGLNKKKFRYLLLSYTGYGFGLNVLNRISKIGIFCLKQGRKISDFVLTGSGYEGPGRTSPPKDIYPQVPPRPTRHTANKTNSLLPHRHTELKLYTCYPTSQ